ncbi:MAG: T9SS type A sorting domain-containing protein [Bacteroidia bacterium]|nr:T9SS type A sorting domain-containing protein [Bacteroidia bacterium]
MVSRGGGMTHIQVGQGFFARSKEGGGTINFTYAMREHATAATFKSAYLPWPSIELKAATKDLSRTTSVTFNDAMTPGLDPSYDAGVLKSGGGLELYTRLVEDNGSDFAIQCLPDVSLDKMVIPVSLDLTTGGEVTFSAKSANLPSGYVPVLEDRQTGISTLLNAAGASYKVVLPSNTKGINRFYLHLNAIKSAPVTAIVSAVVIPDVARLKVYPIGKEIHIQGVVEDRCVASLYDLNGRSVGVYQLQAADNITLYPEGINNGIYLLRIMEGNAQRFIGKMILR